MGETIVDLKQIKAVDAAWVVLPQNVRDYIRSLGDEEYLKKFLTIVSSEIRMDISDESLARNARDRLKANVLSIAHQRGDEGIYKVVIESVRADMQADNGALSGKERQR